MTNPPRCAAIPQPPAPHVCCGPLTAATRYASHRPWQVPKTATSPGATRGSQGASHMHVLVCRCRNVRRFFASATACDTTMVRPFLPAGPLSVPAKPSFLNPKGVCLHGTLQQDAPPRCYLWSTLPVADSNSSSETYPANLSRGLGRGGIVRDPSPHNVPKYPPPPRSPWGRPHYKQSPLGQTACAHSSEAALSVGESMSGQRIPCTLTTTQTPTDTKAVGGGRRSGCCWLQTLVGDVGVRERAAGPRGGGLPMHSCPRERQSAMVGSH